MRFLRRSAETGLYVRGATSDAGLKTNGSYMVQWAFVRWLKEHGFQHYDLNGIRSGDESGNISLQARFGREAREGGRVPGAISGADNPLSAGIVNVAEYWRMRRGRAASVEEDELEVGWVVLGDGL